MDNTHVLIYVLTHLSCLEYLELFAPAIALAIVFVLPPRKAGLWAYRAIVVLLSVLSVPFLLARWIFYGPRPSECQSHSFFCGCDDCESYSTRLEQLFEREP